MVPFDKYIIYEHTKVEEKNLFNFGDFDTTLTHKLPQDTLNSSEASTSKQFVESSKYEEDEANVNKSPFDKHEVNDSTADKTETKNISEGKQTNPFQSKFACAHSSSSTSHQSSPNAFITAEFKKLLEVYKTKNDTWRVMSYQKAITAIENYPEKITSYEVARNIRGVGDKLAKKVIEIVNSGKLRKVEEVYNSEETKVVSLFMGVWGAGPSTANAWYSKGYRSIEDLKSCPNLTKNQKVGVRLYDDLNDRIPRDEVQKIHDYVSGCCEEIKKGLTVEVCGSYRRGRATCGDVDVLITHSDGISHAHVFKSLLNLLRNRGFLTDDLVTQEDNGNQQKYLGVCKLPGDDTKHRRLDIIVVPYSEFAPALLYFTGSAHFNRSMRLLAIKMGMSLSEHGLKKNIVRQGKSKLSHGVLLDSPSEESIFKHLGLEYRPPSERDH